MLNLRKTLVSIFVLLLGLSLTGCSLIERSVSNIRGWDLSACVGKDEFKVCRELFLDNQEKILGGRTLVELAIERMKSAKTARSPGTSEENE